MNALDVVIGIGLPVCAVGYYFLCINVRRTASVGLILSLIGLLISVYFNITCEWGGGCGGAQNAADLFQILIPAWLVIAVISFAAIAYRGFKQSLKENR